MGGVCSLVHLLDSVFVVFSPAQLINMMRGFPDDADMSMMFLYMTYEGRPLCLTVDLHQSTLGGASCDTVPHPQGARVPGFFCKELHLSAGL